MRQRSNSSRCPFYLFDLPQKPWNFVSLPDTLSGMHKIIKILISVFREIFVGRTTLHIEILALRQQVAVLKRKRYRPSLQMADRVFWVILSCLWPGWRHSLVIVKPETVIGWHRKRFRLFWTWKSRRGKPGRPPVSREIRDLIRRMSRENTLWGALRIHGRSARLSPPRLPCPEKPKPLAVPTDDGLGLDDYQGVAPARPEARQNDPENPIGHPKRWLGPSPFQDSYLLAEGEDFCVERRAVEEDFAEHGEEHFDDLLHAGKGIRWWWEIPRFLRRMG